MKSLPAILLASTLCVACTTPPPPTKSVMPKPIVHDVYVRDATVIHDDVELGGAAIRMPEHRDYLYDAHYIGDARSSEPIAMVEARKPDDKSIYAKAKDQSIYARDRSIYAQVKTTKKVVAKKATTKTNPQKKATKKSKKAPLSAKTVTSVSGIKVAPTITAVKDEF